MAKQGKTSNRVARAASKTLTNTSASAKAKSVAGSALAQTRSGKKTSAKAAKRGAEDLWVRRPGTLRAPPAR